MLDISWLMSWVLQILGVAILALLTAAAKYALNYLQIKLTEAQKAELEDVAGKALAYGLARANDMVKAKGWDHVEVKQAAIATAINYAAQKFPNAMERSQVNISSMQSATAALSGVMERKYGDAVTIAAASPATPEVDPKKPLIS